MQRSTDPTRSDTEAVRRCFEAYGADTAKWPSDKRVRYAMLAASDEFDDLREEAASLDGFLNASTAPRMSADLKARIAAEYVPPAAAKSIFAGLVARGVFWRPVQAGAAAGLGALGFIAGLASTGQTALAPEYEAYAYMEEAATLAMLDEEEEGVSWDAD